MALINQNSLIGITSITSPGASNVLTVHTNDTTERLRVTANGLSFSGTNASLDTSGNLTVGGNVSVGGTLTYEDVTNIDSVGVLTARSDVSIADKIVHTGDTNTAIRFPADDTITAETAGLERLRIDSNGNIGINTTSPTNYANYVTLCLSDTLGSEIQLRKGSTIQAAVSNIGDIFYLEAKSSVPLVCVTNGSERLRITSTGKIGIGMDPTSQYFNNLVIGNNDSGDKGITIRTNSDSSGILAFSDTDAGNANRYDGYIRYSHVDQHMGFYTSGGNERLRITSDAKVGINVSNPDLTLHVNGVNALPSSSGSTPAGHLTLRAKASSSSHGMFMGVSNASPWGSWIQAQDANNNATNYPLLLNPNGGNVGVGGLTNPGALLSIPAGESNTPRFAIESAVDDNDFTITQYEDGNGTYTMLGQNVKLNSGGNNTILDSGHRTAAIQLDARNHGAITFLTGGTNAVSEPVKITSAGEVQIANGNLKFSTAGTGIDFSATSDAGGMQSEILDDYEEGTFTPTVYGGNTAGTFNVYSNGTNSGFYVKIGQYVHMIIHWKNVYLTGATGNLILGNLPFSFDNTNLRLGGFSSYLEGFTPAFTKTFSGSQSVMFRRQTATSVTFRPSSSSHWDVYLNASTTNWQRSAGTSAQWTYGEIHLYGHTPS